MSIRPSPLAATLLIASLPAAAGEKYRLPPADVVAIVDAPPPPSVSIAPDGERLLQAFPEGPPPIERLAQPMLRLAGVRFDPARNRAWSTTDLARLAIQRVSDGAVVEVKAADGFARFASPEWSPDGARLAFGVVTDDGVELWIAEAATGAARRLVGPELNATLDSGFSWEPDARSLLVRLVPEGRGDWPLPSRVPEGPLVQETAGRKATNSTYQDLLQSPADEKLFEHAATSQLARVTLDGGVTPLGAPGIFLDAQTAPDGTALLVERVHRPYSCDVPVSRFPRAIEVWDREGRLVRTVADVPLMDEVPTQGAPTGPRSVAWQPLAPSPTLCWIEAQDGGDPRRKVEHRDRIVRLAAPFEGEPAEVARVKERVTSIAWTDRAGVALVTEFDRDRRWTTTSLRELVRAGAPGSVLFDRSINDLYGDPGAPVRHRLADGSSVVRIDEGGAILLAGAGATPAGNRPFLDRLELESRRKERLFQSTAESYETFVGLAGPGSGAAPSFVTRRESRTEPPNYFFAPRPGTERRALTNLPDPHPQITGIRQELVTTTRADGVALSGMLYLPPGYEPGRRLPLVISAYPLEFSDAGTAGQVSAAPNRFVRLGGTSELLFLTQGYAVLANATMPVVGDPETMNDTFVQQIVDSARAEIEAVVQKGVVDRDRVGVMGHSYGAFMVANLLAHSDLFRAGIARSGAYNRTLTPFGFQGERRSLWEATDTYVRMSPFLAAAKLDEPILLIHGEADNNPGTFPIQSERLFDALQGLGGTARLVVLPHESHGYSARESVLHVLAESFDWFDKHVKNAAPRAPAGAGG